MSNSPIYQNADEIIQFRNDMSEVKVQLAVLKTNQNAILRYIEEQKSTGKKLMFIAVNWLPNILTLAAIGWLAMNGYHEGP